MNFQLQKKKQLSKKDKSSIGSWDFKIKSLCDKINKKKNYYTTSSCSGRVVLLKGGIEKTPDKFLFRTHDKISFKELEKTLENVGKEYKNLVEFQETSCILHVACAQLSDAFEIVGKAKLAGWKRSGVMSSGKRVMVELHSTESMSFPVMSNGKVLINDDFLKLVVKEANERLERCWEKVERLEGMV